jgi:hypothetical protein
MSDRLFSPNHETHLLTTFKYVDEVVTQAVSRLEAAARPSPFSEYVADADSLQRKTAADDLDRLRAVMRGFLDSHKIAIPKASMSALWAASTACVHAGVSVEELSARYLKAYGALSPAAAVELERLVAELTDVLRKMNVSLAEAAANPTKPKCS